MIPAVLLRPIINEKSMILVQNGFYTFEVDKNSNKDQVRKVVSDKFGVTVLSVKVVNTKSKKKMQRSRKGYYETGSIKKAIVQLKKGDRIALFEVAAADEEPNVTVTTAEGEPVIKTKEKKSLLKGTKVKVEKVAEKKGEKV